MTPTSQRFTQLSERLDDRPDFAADWLVLALILLVGYGVTVWVHLLELSNWSGPALRVGGERILATHDAYCWLAGAKGVNGYAQFGMARLAALLASITGWPLSSIGFWTPPLLAGFTAVATGLWAWQLAGRRAAIIPALLGALSPGFYFRSRLGYYDSDVFTQLMPLLLGFLLAALIAPCCSRSWRASESEREASAPLARILPWLALGFGLVARVAHFAHDDIHPLGIGLFWLALGLAAVTGLPAQDRPTLGRPSGRTAALRFLLVYGLAAYAGPRHFGVDVFAPGLADLPGLILAAALAWLLWRVTGAKQAAPARPSARRLAAWGATPWPWLAGIIALALAGGLLLPLGVFWAKALSYFKPVADAAVANAPSYPGITQSIREAKNVADVGTALAGMSVSATLGALGVLGVLALLILRPTSLLLAPTMILGFSSLVLGTRFTMFGGPVLALGLGIGIHWTGKALVAHFQRGGRLLVWGQILVATGCLLLAYIPVYSLARPTPVLSPAHVEALLSFRDAAPKDAVLWTWWDYGYATQYFSERMTPSDGGKHAGRDIFATALALSTDSFRQANQVIRLSASQNNDPAQLWDTMSATAVRQELAELRESDVPLPAVRPQYMEVGWENLVLLYWINYYGSWDVVRGTGQHSRVAALHDSVTIDNVNGTLVRKRTGSTLPLASAEILSDKGVERIAMPEHKDGAHLLVNKSAGQAVLLDSLAYNSMAVQLLIGNPARPEQARYFKILHEGFPLVRIYEVLPGASAAAQAKVKNQ
ncbi:MAG: STT3 domain-containing protein [Humidesulfovibrio sp.]|nr:STT3 domain-containing protein [Humidesulfovibrio sp.]